MEQLYIARVGGQSSNLGCISWSALNIICVTSKQEPFPIYLIHPNSPEECFTISSPHEDAVTIAEWTSTGAHLLTADENKLLVVWKTEVNNALMSFFTITRGLTEYLLQNRLSSTGL